MARNREHLRTGIEIPAVINGRQNPEYFSAYYVKNRERILSANRERGRNGGYREMHLRAADYKSMLIEVLIQRDGEDCGVCGKPLNGKWTIDHIVPRCCGGADTADNIQLAHAECNARKSRGGNNG